MSAPLLLDTCALLWSTVAQAELHDEARDAIAASRARDRVFLSPVSAWEIAMLVRRGRFRLDTEVGTYVRDVFSRRGIRVAALTPKIAAASEDFPEGVLRDRADRLIAATAREMGLRVVTRDRGFVQLHESGDLDVLAC